MPLIIKSESDEEKTPHLAMTHNELQGGAANKRNVSLLMKSDAEMTVEVVKALTELGLGVADSPLSTAITAGVDSETLEASGSDAVNKSQEEVITLQEEIQKAVQAAETILKAQIVEKEQELQKALETIKQFEEDKVQAVAKSRQAAIAKVEADVDAAAELFKGLESVSDETFEVVLKALGKEKDKVQDSDLMKELGGNGRDLTPELEQQVDKTAELLKAQYNKGAK